ncbi:hypothetical protein GCM10009789_41460 [Kribbella sancticallisti]|uniref:Uncharacterized protein n=1 Tax=Kribbella sancticallisti TaxID=460087 RepID=A0ABN2DS18_9ACTN
MLEGAVDASAVSVTRVDALGAGQRYGVHQECAADALTVVAGAHRDQSEMCLDVAVALQVGETPDLAVDQRDDAVAVLGLVARQVHGRVRISAPVLVTRRVCSNCAVRDLSLVVAVQPSSHRS